MAKKKNGELFLIEMVEEVMKEKSLTRDNDKLLTTELWKKYFPNIVKQAKSGKHVLYLEDVLRLPKYTSIKRERQILQQEEHRYLPLSLVIAIKRKIPEDVWRKKMTKPITENPRKY